VGNGEELSEDGVVTSVAFLLLRSSIWVEKIDDKFFKVP